MANFIQSIAQYLSKSNQKLREARKIIPMIQEKENYYMTLSTVELGESTKELRRRLTNGEGLDGVLPDAFAIVREAAKRILYQRPYDVQMIGAYIMHKSMISEMYTGEGKTLVALITAYLNALPGKGVQVVTVNDYLAKRDSESVGKILKYLGLKVGLIQENMSSEERKRQYLCDVTYVSNHEIAFDYLRDNMESSTESQVLIGRMNCGIVDEADSIFLDEGKTPLIISGPGQQSSKLYEKLTPIVQKLDPKVHLEFDEFKSHAYLTECGMDFIEENLWAEGILKEYEIKPQSQAIDEEETKPQIPHQEVANQPQEEEIQPQEIPNQPMNEIYMPQVIEINPQDLSSMVNKEEVKNGEIYVTRHLLYEPKNLLIVHYVNQLIKANFIMKKDVDYIVSQSDEVVIIDQNTGRLSFGRRFSDGLHQALEAKEAVEIKKESVVLATTTYQSFFRLFPKLCGMTGTAKDDEEELSDVYNLEVVQIPTNRVSKKIIHRDRLFFKNETRLAAVCQLVEETQKKGQPILLITLTVNDSEILSKALEQKKIPHSILNAKNHEKEAEIVREAGRYGSVTVATDIAGRGTDIQLGGCRSHLISLCQMEGKSEEEIAEKINQLEKDKAEVSALGGLSVISLGRHESKRLDNQASGRCGRQGEPGEVRFFLSLDDELFQNSMGNSAIQQWSIGQMLESGDEYIDGSLVESLVANIQNSKALASYESRKHLFRYDKIIDVQRKIVYEIRNNLLKTPVVKANFDKINNPLEKSSILLLGEGIFINTAEQIIQSIDYSSHDSVQQTQKKISDLFQISLSSGEYEKKEEEETYIQINLMEQLRQLYRSIITNSNEDQSIVDIAQSFKNYLIRSCDKSIQKYLQAISDGKDGSYLSSYAQKDPVNEFNSRMMGILSDFFLEWQKIFINFVLDNNNQTVNSWDSHSLDDNLKNLRYLVADKMAESEGEGELKANPVLEEERMQLKNEISDILTKHLKNDGGLEYYDENEEKIGEVKSVDLNNL